MSNYILTADGELYHYGVPGMKWGQRKARGHAGPGKYATRKRQLAGDKRDLEGLKNGQHLSVGLTKKRQAAFDARDKRLLEKRIAENEAKLTKKQLEKEYGKLEDQMTYGKNADKKKNASISKKMSDIEKQMNRMDKSERNAKASEKALAKIEKQQYKDFVKKRSKEILAGESFAGKVYDVLTDAHKYQAQIEYDMEKRSKVNKTWRD